MLRSFLVVLILAGSASAMNPIATLTAVKSVSVNGVEIATRGVPSLPLVNGDVVTTGDDPAIINLSDGSSFMLQKNSSVRIQQCGATSVEVLQGSTTYRFANGSKAQLCALGHPATAKAMLRGSLTIESPDKAVLRTPDQSAVSLPKGHCLCETQTVNHHTTILVVAVAGAAALALGLGLALTLPGSVSPSTPTT
jgi:hypothetical protein